MKADLIKNLTNIRNSLEDYSNQIILDKKAIAKSVICSFVVSTVITSNPLIGVTAAALSAIATVVSAVTIPIFRKIFENNGVFSWKERIIVICSSLIIVGGIASDFGSSLLIHSLFISTLLNWILIADTWDTKSTVYVAVC